MPTTWFLTDERYLSQRMPTAVIRWLADRGRQVRVVTADRGQIHVAGGEVDCPWRDLRGGDVVVARTRHPLALVLLAAAARDDVATVPSPAALDAVRDKARGAGVLAAAGIPAPETFVVADTSELASVVRAGHPLVLKPHLGDNGRGLTVVDGPDQLSSLRWQDDLVLAQRWIESDGWDVKLYVCDDQVWAVRRPSPLLHQRGVADVPLPVPVTPELREIALAAQRAFGLPLCGIDVVLSEEGPLVVDVNDFPNYKGVPEAAEAIGSYLLGCGGRRATAEVAEVAACAS